MYHIPNKKLKKETVLPFLVSDGTLLISGPVTRGKLSICCKQLRKFRRFSERFRNAKAQAVRHIWFQRDGENRSGIPELLQLEELTEVQSHNLLKPIPCPPKH